MMVKQASADFFRLVNAARAKHQELADVLSKLRILAERVVASQPPMAKGARLAAAPGEHDFLVFSGGTVRSCDAAEVMRLKNLRLDLCLDLEQRVAWVVRNGRREESRIGVLSALAQGLLFHLAGESPRGVTIEDLYQQAGYGPDHEVELNPVHKAICALRKVMGSRVWITCQRNCVVGGQESFTRYAFTPCRRRYLLIFPEGTGKNVAGK